MARPPPLPKHLRTMPSVGASPKTESKDTNGLYDVHDLEQLTNDLVRMHENAQPMHVEDDTTGLIELDSQKEFKRQEELRQKAKQKAESPTFTGTKYGEIQGQPQGLLMLLAKNCFPETLSKIDVNKSQFRIAHFMPDKRWIHSKIGGVERKVVDQWHKEPEEMISLYVREMNHNLRNVILDIRREDNDRSKPLNEQRPLSEEEFKRTFSGERAKRVLRQAALFKEESHYGGYVILPIHFDAKVRSYSVGPKGEQIEIHDPQQGWYHANVALHQKTHYFPKIPLDEELALALHKDSPHLFRGRVQRYFRDQEMKKIEDKEKASAYLVLEGTLVDKKGNEVAEPKPLNLGKGCFVDDKGNLLFDQFGTLKNLERVFPKGHPTHQGFRSKIQWKGRWKAIDVGTTPHLKHTPLDSYKKTLSEIVLSDDPLVSFASNNLKEKYLGDPSQNNVNPSEIITAMAGSGLRGTGNLREYNEGLYAAVKDHPLYLFWKGKKTPQTTLSGSWQTNKEFCNLLSTIKHVIKDDKGNSVVVSEDKKKYLVRDELNKTHQFGISNIHKRMNLALSTVFGKDKGTQLYQTIKNDLTMESMSAPAVNDVELMYIYALTDSLLGNEPARRKKFDQFVLTRVAQATHIERGLIRMYFPEVGKHFFPYPQIARESEIGTWTGVSREMVNRQSDFSQVWEAYTRFQEIQNDYKEANVKKVQGPPVTKKKRDGLFRMLRRCVEYVTSAQSYDTDGKKRGARGLKKEYVAMCPGFDDSLEMFKRRHGLNRGTGSSSMPQPPMPRGYRHRK